MTSRSLRAAALALAAFLALADVLQCLPFRFMTTSDSHITADKGTKSNTAFGYVVSHMSSVSPVPDFWIFGGDAYDDASDSADAMVQWQAWKGIAAPIADIPIYLAIGNHDANIYSHDWDGVGPFRASWPSLPQNGPAGYVGTVYSFRYDNSLFCVVNTNIYYPSSYSARFKVDAVQRGWLASVLDTTTALHKFVIGHVEAWPPSDGSGNSSLQWNAAARDSFWQVMTSHGVEAYICGHIHLWNKDFFTASGFGNPPSDTTTRQIICGGAGGGLVSGYGGNFYHFVVWDIDGPSVAARVIDSYGNLRDSVKYSVPTGVASQPPHGVDRAPMIRNIRLAGGRLLWDGYVGHAAIAVFNMTGQKLWEARAQGGTAAWEGTRRPGGKNAASGLYFVRIAPENGGTAAVGRILVVR